MSTSNLDMQKLRSLLTTRQVQVLALIQAGYTRRQIAARLKPQVCKQAVHQIVGRMRIRLHVMAGVPLQGWRRRNGTY
jgi:DNA-binding NarL/FixJ family response regulator